MQYPLYEYYSHGSMNLYEIRNHYLSHFYYQCHSRKEAESVLHSIVYSSKVSKLLLESSSRKVAPNYEDFTSTVCSMFKFMFKSNDTLVLAVINAALRWDIEVNKELHLIGLKELTQDVIRVFNKFSIYKEMPDREFASVVNPTVEAELIEEPMKELPIKHDPKQTTWTFLSFAQEFGTDVSVGMFHRKVDGDIFHSCIFTDNEGHKTFVGFSTKLGVLTAEEISQMKDELVVIKSPSGNYNLFKDNGKRWKKVKL